MLRIVVLGGRGQAGGRSTMELRFARFGLAAAQRWASKHPGIGSAISSRRRTLVFLINASPDLRQQLIATPQLHPEKGPTAASQPDRPA